MIKTRESPEFIRASVKKQQKTKRIDHIYKASRGASIVASESNYDISSKDAQMLIKKNQNLSVIKGIFEQVLNKRAKGKMFNIVSGTWNPVTGCLYNCKYCWARDLATTKLMNANRYKQGFKPILNENEFRSRFGKGDLIFVSDMGDLFGEFVQSEWIQKVFDHTAKFPEAKFLFMTKNPSRYYEFLDNMPSNAILGATIETNIDEIVKKNLLSNAPMPSQRYKAMKDLDWRMKIISIEPILDFDLETLSGWIRDIYPFLVYVGYDNYNHELKEPSQSKTEQLLDNISDFTLVVRKTIRPAWFEEKAGLKQEGE